MESRSRVSLELFLALLEFMESHGDIARPQQGAQGRIRADCLWQELRESTPLVEESINQWKNGKTFPVPSAALPPPSVLSFVSTPMPSATCHNASLLYEANHNDNGVRRPLRPRRHLPSLCRGGEGCFEHARGEYRHHSNEPRVSSWPPRIAGCNCMQLHEDRERNNHQREMKRLRLESRRIEMAENRNLMFNRDTKYCSLTEILPQLRPSSWLRQILS